RDAAGKLRHLLLAVDRPEQRGAGHRVALQHAVEIDRLRTEPHAVLGEELAILATKSGALRRDRTRRQHTERFAKLIDQATRRAIEFGVTQPHQRRETAALLHAPEGSEPAADRLAQRRIERMAGED